MTMQRKLLTAMGMVALTGSLISTTIYAAPVRVIDTPTIQPYANAKRNCTGLTPLPVDCRFPRYYRVKQLTNLTDAAALNNVGQVVGVTSGKDNRWSAAYWQKGKVTDVGILGCRSSVSSCQSSALGINDLGKIVGISHDYNNFGVYSAHAFLWNGDSMIRLPEIGNDHSTATDINNNGVIVGYGSWRDDYKKHGWVNTGGQQKVIGEKGEESAAYAVNEHNHVVGSIQILRGNPPTATSLGFLLKDGTMTLFDGFSRVGGSSTIANDLNDSATPNVVGQSTNAENKYQAFLWRPGVLFDLGTLPGTDTSIARAINNRRQIVGQSGGKAVLWQNGELHDINRYLTDMTVTMSNAIDIDKRGTILAQGSDHAFYLLYAQY